MGHGSIVLRQVEQAALRKKLEVEDRRVKSMREKAKSVDLKEDEIHNLQDELAQLQVRSKRSASN